MQSKEILDQKNKKPQSDLGRDLFAETSSSLVSNNLGNNCRLEINIISTSDEYQEVEILYRGKRRKRKLTKFLPENFASNFESLVKLVSNDSKPSGKVGVTNLGNLSQGDNFVLKEKLLRILAKINQVSEIKTVEKIWDSQERISTADKSILLAVVNSILPENEKIDRAIVSQRSYEITNQEAFKKFISATIDLTKDSKKLADFLFGDITKNLSEEKKSHLAGCLRNILSEENESNCAHQIKFLSKILDEVSRLAQK